MPIELSVNPITSIIECAESLYPDLNCCIYWDSELDHEQEGYGFCEWVENEPPRIAISTQLEVENTIEIIAHEIAHAVAGEHNDHNEIWEEVFQKIRNKWYETMKDNDNIQEV